MGSINILLPTIRFSAMAKDIMAQLFRTGEENRDVHVTIADGQENEEKKRWILASADLLSKHGRFTYIGLQNPTERLYRAAQIESEWVLLVADDDLFSINYLRCALDAVRTAEPAVTAFVPRLYLSYSPKTHLLYRLKPINGPDQRGRLTSLFTQGHNGLLTFGVMRRRLFREWMDFVRTKPIWPSYSDQLFVGYLAMKGWLLPMAEECAILKDDSDWHDPPQAIRKDACSYQEEFLTLFHEVFWTADLFAFLRERGLEDEAVPAVMGRVRTLLGNGAANFPLRLSVLDIKPGPRVREAKEHVQKLAAQADTMLAKSLHEQIRFLEEIVEVSRSLDRQSGPAPAMPEQDERRGKTTPVSPFISSGTESGARETDPAVSVIVPCYAQADFLAEAIESVVTQTFGDWECLIVDDGSPDHTAQVARDLIARYPDKRIRLIRKTNGGLSDARNAGIREARGRYILPLDADDRLDPRYLAETVPILERNLDIAIVYVDERNFGEAEHVHRKGVVTLGNLLVGNVHDYCSLYRRSVWERVGGYSPAMYLGAEDWCFWIGAAKLGFRSYHVGQPLFWYRRRRGTMVERVQANMNVIKAHIVFHYPDLFIESGKEKARLVLSSPSEAVCEQLKKARALHPDNELLEVFSRFMQGGEESSKPTVLQGTGMWVNEREARWVKVATFLEQILREICRNDPNRLLRILDVGCGSGWLTDRVLMYGSCEGVDPDPLAIADARRQFPHLRFEVCELDRLPPSCKIASYDVILCSRLLEGITQEERDTICKQLVRLLKPNGYLILTMRRGEAWEQWRNAGVPSNQVETWMTEAQVAELVEAHGFRPIQVERLYVEIPERRYVPAPTPADLKSRHLIPLDQVWVCRVGMPASPSTVRRRPTVSVIVPTCNRPDRLREALQSVLAQSYRDFEVIVVNDGAVDVGAAVDALNTDGRITLIKHDRNRGLAAARNTGLRMARGKYIAYLDDDDRYLPDHLETLVTALRKGLYKVAYSDAWRVHERCERERYVEVGRDLPYSQDFSLPRLLVGNYFPVLCVMHERSCMDEVGFFDESLFAHEDWDLWIRMAEKFPFLHIKKVTAEFTWRTDGSSMTSSTRHTYYRTTDIIYQKYRPLAEQFSGVLAAQEQQLAEFKKQFRSDRFVCSIIIPVYNNLELTKQCLTALASVTTGVDYEVILVDNGSTDGTAAFLQTLQGDVRIIRNDENRGFAKACNQGAKEARGKYLVFLNNDTIPQSNWLGPLVQEVDGQPDVGIVGSKLLYPDDTVQHAGVVFSRDGAPYHIYRRVPADSPAVGKRREFQAVTAACLLIRRDLFEAVGGFDEAFVNGFEDVDLCLKVRGIGFRVIYQPRSVLIHLEGQTLGRKAGEADNYRLLRERWSNLLWLEDEDLHYHTDGYKLVGDLSGANRATRIVPLTDVRDRAAWAHVAAAQAAALKKDWEAVRRELHLADDWPNDRFVLDWGASVAKRLQEPAAHTRFLSRFVSLTDEPAERLALARLLLEQKNLPAAEEQVRMALASVPDHPEGLFLQGVLCMQREQYAEAERMFSTAFHHGADRAKCLMGMGMAAMGRSYPQGAWEKFCEVLADHPDDPEAIHWLLRAGTAQNRWEELIRYVRAYVERNPGDLATRFALAGVLLRADRIEEARKEQEVIRALDPAHDGLAELEQAISKKEAVLAVEATEG
jgi:GT2 family glycosyltransferase/SAM-dependent methyltransferase/Flp pilus assembly protein TadD